MKHIQLNLSLVLQFIFTISALSFSNPLETTPLSEIQVVDQSHWTIEFDFREAGFGKPYPVQTDTIVFFCSRSSGIPSVDSMKRCNGMIDIDTNGIALITQQHFPSIRINPDWTLFVGLKGMPYYFKSLTIPRTIFPEGTLISGYTEPVCCDYVAGNCLMYCRSLTYLENQCSSLGTRNQEAVALVNGEIKDSSGNPVGKIKIECKNDNTHLTAYSYSSDGRYSFRLPNFCAMYTLTFSDQADNLLKTGTVGPFECGEIFSLSTIIDIPTNTVQKKKVLKSTGTRLLSASVTKGIVIAFSGTAFSPGEIHLYSTNGKLVRKLHFNVQGSGTYTIRWDGKNEGKQTVPPGRYTARVLIDGQFLCGGILNF